MVQRDLSVLAGVTSASDTVLWTGVASRVWFAAVWPWSMWSGSSAQLCGMLVWWAPRHGGVANSGKVWPSAGHSRPRNSISCICNTGNHALSPLHHRLLGLAVQAPCRPSCWNRGKLVCKGAGEWPKEPAHLAQAWRPRLACRDSVFAASSPQTCLASAASQGVHHVMLRSTFGAHHTPSRPAEGVERRL